MRSARDVPVSISLSGRLAETGVVFGGEKELKENWSTLERAVRAASELGERDQSCKLGILWKEVPYTAVRNAVESFQNHPECMLTYPDPLIEYIDWLAAEGHDRFDVLLRTVEKNEAGALTQVAGHEFHAPIRTVSEVSSSRIAFTKRRVASKGDERAGLSPDEIANVRALFEGDNIPDKEYRKVPGRAPLFMINFVAVRTSEEGMVTLNVPTYSLSFPGDSAVAKSTEKRVQYRVNTVWWEKNFYTPNEEED